MLVDPWSKSIGLKAYETRCLKPQFCLFVTKLYVLTISAREKPSHHLVLNQLSSQALPGRSLSTNTRVSLASILASEECWITKKWRRMHLPKIGWLVVLNHYLKMIIRTCSFGWLLCATHQELVCFLSHMCHFPSKRWYDDQGDRNHQVL